MPKKEAPLDYLNRFIPSTSSKKIMEYLYRYSIHLTITRDRKSVYGDYRHATKYENHRISVNSGLNKYAFLITLIHEIAHLLAFTQYGNKIQSHGKEWKAVYAGILKEFIALNVFPEDILNALRRSMNDLPASSCADENLMRVLRNYDEKKNGHLLVEQVEEGGLFDMGDGRIFKKGKKLRKRFECIELATGNKYLFSGVYEVRVVSR